MKLKSILKQLMKRDALTLAKLSKATGVPKQTLHNWLMGIEPRNVNQLKSVATYFEMTIEEICYGEVRTLKGIDHLYILQEEINLGLLEVVLRRVKQPEIE